MPPRATHSHWLGKSPVGLAQYKALVCGHVVHHPETKTCRDCPHLRTKASRKHINPRYLRMNADRQSVYMGECGHEVLGNRTKMCRPCRANLTTSYKKTFRKDGRSVAVHTVIAEQVLGRPLKRNEMVHHINLIKTDNRNANLLICTREYHQQLHHAMEKAYGAMCCPPPPAPT